MEDKKIEAIYIEWCDAVADISTWMGIEEAIEWGDNEDWVVKQVAFVLKETEEYLLLVSKINPHSHTEEEVRVSGLLKLPKTWIRKRISLTELISSSSPES